MRLVAVVAAALVVGVAFGGADSPNARIVYENGMPMISVDGRSYEPDWVLLGYDYYWHLDGAEHAWTEQAVRRFSSLGFHFLQLNVEFAQYEKAVGVYDFTEVGRQAEKALSIDPNLWLMMSIRLNGLDKWLTAHPEEAVVYGDGKLEPGSDEHRGHPFRPSPASRAFREEGKRVLVQFCEWVKSQPWGNRVVMVRPNWGIYKEWHMFGMWHSPDVGPRMTEAFRRYRNGKYAADNPPTMAERRTGGFMYDPVRDEKVVDFYLCMAEQIVEMLEEFAHTIKVNLPGRLVGMWYGYLFTDHAPEGANVLLDRVLANPDIDFLSDPATYRGEARYAGGSYMHRTVPATYHRYAKLCMLEDDTRCDWVTGIGSPWYTLRSPAETVAVLERNYLLKLFDRCGIQYNDAVNTVATNRPYAFDNEIAIGAINAARDAFRLAKPSVPAVGSGLKVAVVADYRERFYWDSHSRDVVSTGHDLYEMSPLALYRSGAAFDVLTLDDYLASSARYSTVVLFNLFHTPADLNARLNAKLAADGSRVVRLSPEGPIPTDGESWAKLLGEAGAHLYVAPGGLFRRIGDVMMFSTGEAGRHVITLPAADRAKSFRELLHGGGFSGDSIVLECSGPMTWLLAPEPR